MIPPGCLVMSFTFHFPIWICCDLESSKRNHQLFSGWAWTSRNILMLLQPSSIGVSSRSSPQPAVEQWGACLRLNLSISWEVSEEHTFCHFLHQDFSFKQTKRDVGVGVDGNPCPSPHICWLNYPCHLQVLTCFNDVFKGLVIPSYCTSSSVGSPIIYRVL